jgi:hypothetical protein
VKHYWWSTDLHSKLYQVRNLYFVAIVLLSVFIEYYSTLKASRMQFHANSYRVKRFFKIGSCPGNARQYNEHSSIDIIKCRSIHVLRATLM